MRLRLVDGNYGTPGAGAPEFITASGMIMGIADTLALELPEIEQLCGALYSSGVLMIAGVAGVGKSLFALHLAAHIAAGKNLGGWHTPKARPVLYVDGEMAPQYLQSRLKAVPHSNLLSLIHLESMRRAGGNLDLSQQRWRDWFLRPEVFESHDVFIFDTVSSLVLSHTEGEMFSPEYWLQLELFHRTFRAAGKTVVWIDNLNKRGEVFGTALKHHKVDSMWTFEKWDDCPYLRSAAFTMNQDKLRGDSEPADGRWYFHPDKGWNNESGSNSGG